MDVGRHNGHGQYDAASGITLKFACVSPGCVFPPPSLQTALRSSLAPLFGWMRRMILREPKSNICQFLLQSWIGSSFTTHAGERIDP